jgi:hypothetical protein
VKLDYDYVAKVGDYIYSIGYNYHGHVNKIIEPDLRALIMDTRPAYDCIILDANEEYIELKCNYRGIFKYPYKLESKSIGMVELHFYPFPNFKTMPDLINNDFQFKEYYSKPYKDNINNIIFDKIISKSA